MPDLARVSLRVGVFLKSLFVVRVWDWLSTVFCALILLGHLCVILEAFELRSVAKAIKLYSAYNKLLICLFCSS